MNRRSTDPSHARPALVRASFLLSTAIVSILAVASCGGGSTTTVTAPATVKEASARQCDVTGADGAVHDLEIDLLGTEESLERALDGKKTIVIGGPGGVANIRTHSKTVFHAIHRELNEIRRILRSC
jgi:hypothetical protein